MEFGKEKYRLKADILSILLPMYVVLLFFLSFRVPLYFTGALGLIPVFGSSVKWGLYGGIISSLWVAGVVIIGYVLHGGNIINVSVSLFVYFLIGTVLGKGTDVFRRQQLELKKNDQEKEILLDNIETHIWYLKDEKTYGLVNQAKADFFGVQKEELENKSLYDLMSTREEAETCIAGNQEVFSKKQKIHSEELVFNGSGEPRLLSITKAPKLDSNNNVEYVVCSAEDITERKQAEKAIKEEEAKYRGIFEAVKDALLIFSKDGIIVEANPAACRIYNYTRQELVGLSGRDIVHPDYHHLFIKFTNDVQQNGYFHSESVDLRRDGSAFDVEINGTAIIFNGRDCLLAIVRDISERKRAENVLRKNEEQLNLFFSQSLSGFFMCMLDEPIEWNDSIDKDKTLEYVFDHQRMTRVNQAMLDQYGATEEDFIGITVRELFQHDLDHAREIWRGLFDRGRWHVETCEQKIDGTPVVIDGDYICIYDEQGRIAGHFGVQVDITERKQAETALQEAKRRLDDIIESSPDATVAVDNTGTVTAWNKAMEEMTLVAKKDMLGKGDYEYAVPFYGKRQPILVDLALLPEDEFARIKDHYDFIYWSGDTLFGEVHCPETYGGKGAYLWASATRLRDASGQIVGAIESIRDITERKRAEEALQESEKRYRQIADNTSDVIWITDMNFNLTYVSPSIERLVGETVEEHLKINLDQKFTPQSLEQIITVFQEEMEKENDPSVDKDRTRIIEVEQYKSDGKTIWVSMHVSILRDEAGNMIGFQGVSRDITERKQAEEKLREHEKLQQLLMEMATDLINVPLEKVDAAINEILEAVGEFTKADSIYIFNHDYNRWVTSNTHEWCAEGITPEIDNLQDLPLERLPDFIEAHQKGEVVHIPNVAQMPEDHAMRPVFEAQGIQSLILLPLFWENVYSGFVGFDAVTRKRVFTEQEINLLKVLAEITSNVLARQKTETKIRYMSFHDQLTGLYNRHFLEIEMERLNTKRQLPLTVIMADLNGLKLVNDTYGHETGDEMLKTAADIIKNSCREEDIIGRFGGDEFVILLPQTTKETARLICKRIKENCGGALVKDVPVSIALGIATKTSETTSLIETLQEAENDMYRQKLNESRSTKSAVVTSLLNTLAEKSFETEEHTRGMQKIARKIGAKLNLPDSELQRLELLITLHDIGKINISEVILTKKSSLTDDEWTAIKKHPEIGYRIAMATEQFAHVAEDILAHHERWDGAGYPQGLKESGISLLARITAIADAYEVMSSGRPYKKAMSKNEITAEFRRCSGAQFDPELVEIFLSVLEE